GPLGRDHPRRRHGRARRGRPRPHPQHSPARPRELSHLDDADEGEGRVNWYRDLKIAAKLMLGFGLVALMAGAVGWIGYTQLHKLNRADTFLFEKATLR